MANNLFQSVCTVRLDSKFKYIVFPYSFYTDGHEHTDCPSHPPSSLPLRFPLGGTAVYIGEKPHFNPVLLFLPVDVLVEIHIHRGQNNIFQTSARRNVRVFHRCLLLAIFHTAADYGTSGPVMIYKTDTVPIQNHRFVGLVLQFKVQSGLSVSPRHTDFLIFIIRDTLTPVRPFGIRLDVRLLVPDVLHKNFLQPGLAHDAALTGHRKQDNNSCYQPTIMIHNHLISTKPAARLLFKVSIEIPGFNDYKK